MKKIPTVFKRNPEDMKRVLPEVTPGCEWVLAGEGVATRKYDGTCCMYDGKRWWARREVKPGKPVPADFRAEGTDDTTGKTVGWVPMYPSSPFSKWHAEALESYDDAQGRVGTYELCGPKINGNPEGFDKHVLVFHGDAEEVLGDGGFLPLDFIATCRERGYEGIVWHHPDGRMAKLKVRDFSW